MNFLVNLCVYLRTKNDTSLICTLWYELSDDFGKSFVTQRLLHWNYTYLKYALSILKMMLSSSLYAFPPKFLMLIWLAVKHEPSGTMKDSYCKSYQNTFKNTFIF